MTGFFHTISEQNKLSLNKPSDSDVVYYSELNEWFTRNAFRSFSLKYVVDECIYYKVGRQEYEVNGGQFMLACKQQDVLAYFDSRRPVRSICIDICPSTVEEAFTILTQRGDPDLENYLAGYFRVPEFFESVSPARTSLFADKLTTLVSAIEDGEAPALVNKEWFLDLVEKVIYQEYGNFHALNGLHSVKLETRKEILRRLRVGREFMDAEYLNINEISEVAQACNMSQFHFFRSFKQAFHISPYQYLLARRLALARTLVHEDEMSLTDIAAQCNFPDLYTFSKAFKRQFGVPPSRLIQ